MLDEKINRLRDSIRAVPTIFRRHDVKRTLGFLVFIIPLIASALIFSEIQKRQSLNSNAGVGTAKVFFEPSSSTIPPEETVYNLWINSSGPVGFARVEFSFDNSLINLSDEITLKQELSRVVQKTSMVEANSSGKVVLVLALDPTMKDSAPSGPFQIASMKFRSLTPLENAKTSVNLDTSSMQIVNMDATVFNLEITNLSLVLNLVATPVAATATPDTCSSCFKGKCDSYCDPRKEDISCSDCSFTEPVSTATPNPSECGSCFKGVCDGQCHPAKEDASCPDCR